jgi:UDPglucose 6-dehydrogenase
VSTRNISRHGWHAVRECHLLIVATGWPDYKAIDPAWCKRSNGSRLTVLDLRSGR